MTTYKGINGFAVQSVATDPSPSDEGQVWYNNATYAFKLATVTTAGTWASGGALGTGRYSLGGFGLQTAAVAVGGYNVVPVTNLTNTEKYDGTAWTASGVLSTGRRYLSGIGFGTQTAGAIYGGVTNTTLPQTYTNATEEFNGSSWSAGGTLNTAKGNAANAGTQTAAIAFGGSDKTPTTGNVALTGTESYNGTSWTNIPATLNTGRSSFAASGKGTQTATLAFGGYNGPPTFLASTESYNGTTWTNVNSLNTARYALSGGGTQTSALAFGGVSPPGTHQSATELWNGTSWTTNPNSMATTIALGGGAGTQSAGISFGGYSNSAPPFGVTYEFTGPGVAETKTITTS